MRILNELKQKIARYLDVHLKLLKINFIGHTSNLMGHFMFALIGLFIAFCIILFLGLGLTEAFILAGMSKMVSFFLTIAVYILFLLVVILLRRNIARFFATIFIKVLTEGDGEEPEEKTDLL